MWDNEWFKVAVSGVGMDDSCGNHYTNCYIVINKHSEIVEARGLSLVNSIVYAEVEGDKLDQLYGTLQ